jgi:hypothetical protein
MDAALDRLGPYLLTLSDGETGPRAWWIGACIQNLAQDPDLELWRHAFDFSDYDQTPQYKLREGATLSVEHLEAALPYAAAFTSSYPTFLELKAKHGRPDLPFQVGIPAHLDLSVDSFGFDLGFAPQYLEPSLEATANQIRRVLDSGAQDVVFQIETPAALIAVTSAGPGAAEGTARHVAAEVARLPASLPPGTRFGVHLCVGDMNHKSMVDIADVTPAVLVANELAAAWPAGRPLEFMHMPFAAAQDPPSLDPAFYQPLASLDVPASVRFVAGCIHESLSTEQQLDLLRLIEDHTGRQADVAAACGLGRRPDVSQAWDAMEKALLLVESSS